MNLRRLKAAFTGMAQLVGKKRVTEPVLPRLAVENWVSLLPADGELRRRVMIVAVLNRTWIEWAVYAACHLRRLGIATTLVYSSSDIRRLYPLSRISGVEQLGFWAGVEEIPNIRLVDVDEWGPTPEGAAAYAGFAKEFAPTVAAYELHVEEHEEGPLAGPYRRGVLRAEERLAAAGGALDRILRENPVSRLVCFSGLVGASPAFCEAARRAGVEVLTVEGWTWRPGHMICNLNAPALEYNLEAWLRAVGEWDFNRERESRRFLRFQEGRLEPGEAPPGNFANAQRSSTIRPLPTPIAAFHARPGPRFLLATNVVGDSSILRRNPIFSNQREWLKQTIAFFRGCPDWNLVVRAHPEEVRIRRKVAVRMGEVARELAGDAPNVLVIDASEDVSSYALMPNLAGGLVWISSIGVDMVARGTSVVAAARPKYSCLDVVEEPKTIPAYFASVSRLASRRVEPTPEQRSRARQYLDLVFSQFSFDAFSPTYRARDLFLDGPSSPQDADVFYKIVAGDLPPETPPRREAQRVA